jgi:hypothetical protein
MRPTNEARASLTRRRKKAAVPRDGGLDKTGSNQLTVILRAFPFAFLGSVSVSTPLS